MEMRLYRLQSSEGNFRLATRSSHSPAPPTSPRFCFDRMRRECAPSFTGESASAMSPSPANDHVDASSMESSTRESSTFFCSQRASAPSSYIGCIGIFGASCCAETYWPPRPQEIASAKHVYRTRLHLPISAPFKLQFIRITPQPRKLFVKADTH